MNQVIIVPGLGDRTDYIERVTQNWPQRYSLEPAVYAFGWYDPAESYDQKQTELKTKIDELTELGQVSIIGISAGGSLAVNVLDRYPDQIACAVNICGLVRIRDKDQSSERFVRSPLLRKSVEEVSTHKILSDRIMTLRPLFDGIVATENVPIEGAQNIRMRTALHGFSIMWALWRRAESMTNFIHEHDK